MAGTEFGIPVLNYDQVGRLLRSEDVLDRLEVRGRRMAAAAGPGFEVERWIGKTRARATVITATREARLASARNHVLLKAIDAGRGK